MSIALVQIVGHLGKDPEQRQAGGTEVTAFSVAVTTKSKGSEATTWFAVSVFGKQAGPCAEYLRKGSKVFVSGRIRLREYEGTKGKGVSLDVNADSVQFLDSKPSGQGRTSTPSGNTGRDPPADGASDKGFIDDDLPFIDVPRGVEP